MHLVATGFGVVTSSVAWKLTQFNNADLWCWIAPLPFDCKESHIYGEAGDCIRGDNAFIYRWAFFYAPLWFGMVTVLILNGMIYFHAKNGEQNAMRREATHFAMHGNPTAGEILTGKSKTLQQQQQQRQANVTSVRLRNPRHRRATMLNAGERIKRPSFFGFDPFNSEECDNGQSHLPSFSMVLPEKIVERLRLHGLFRNIEGDGSHESGISAGRTNASTKSADLQHTSTKNADLQHVLEIIEDYPSAAKQYTATYQFGTRVVVSQSLAYTGAFFLAWSFSSINRVVQHETNTNYFGLLLCQSIFEPLQGLFNLLVYRYAFYLRLKTRNPHLSRWDLFLSTWRWTFLGPPPTVQKRISMKMSPTKGRSSGKPFSKNSGLLSPSARSSSVTNPSDTRDLSLVDRTQASIGDGAFRDEVNVLAVESFNAAEGENDSLMADLMMDYFDNPSMLNQKMVSIQTDYPFYISNDEDVPIPDSYPLQVSPASAYPKILPVPDFPTMNPLNGASEIDRQSLDKSDDETDNNAAIDKNGGFRIPSGRSDTLISVDASC